MVFVYSVFLVSGTGTVRHCLSLIGLYSFHAAPGFLRDWTMDMEWAPPGYAPPPQGAVSYLRLISSLSGLDRGRL